MLFELIIFAVVFVALLVMANVAMFIIGMKYMASGKFIKKYMNVIKGIAEELEDEFI